MSNVRLTGRPHYRRHWIVTREHKHPELSETISIQVSYVYSENRCIDVKRTASIELGICFDEQYLRYYIKYIFPREKSKHFY